MIEHDVDIDGFAFNRAFVGEYLHAIDQFHDPVRVDPKIKDEAGTLNNVMESIASGYACRFKGGCYRPRPQAAPILPSTPWGRHLKQIDEKFDPIYRYVHSAEATPGQKQVLLYDLLEEEFDISLEPADCRRPPSRRPDLAVSKANRIKRTIKRIISQKILQEEICNTLPPHMASQASKATAPMAESARYQA